MNYKSESVYNQSQSRVRFKTRLAMKLDDTTVVFQEAECTDYPFKNVIATQNNNLRVEFILSRDGGAGEAGGALAPPAPPAPLGGFSPAGGALAPPLFSQKIFIN